MVSYKDQPNLEYLDFLDDHVMTVTPDLQISRQKEASHSLFPTISQEETHFVCTPYSI